MQPEGELAQGDGAADGDAPAPAAVGGDEAAPRAPAVVEPGDGLAVLDEEGAGLEGFFHGGNGGAQGAAALEADGFAVVAEHAGDGEGARGQAVALAPAVDDEAQRGGAGVGAEVAAVDAGPAAVAPQGFAQAAVLLRRAFVDDDEPRGGGVEEDGVDARFAAQQGRQPRALRGACEAFMGRAGQGREREEAQQREGVRGKAPAEWSAGESAEGESRHRRGHRVVSYGTARRAASLRFVMRAGPRGAGRREGVCFHAFWVQKRLFKRRPLCYHARTAESATGCCADNC